MKNRFVPLVALVGSLFATGSCRDAVSAPVARIKVFVDRHGPHMRTIATELAPHCPAALAAVPADASASQPDAVARPQASSEPPIAIPFGSLASDATVLQVAATCSKDGSGGPIVASLRDPFVEGMAALPPTGCAEYELPGRGDNDVMKACVDEAKPTTASIVLRRPIEGGIIEVFTSFRLTRR
jgi:hypothetical protein